MAFNSNNLRRQESLGSIGNGSGSVKFKNTYLTGDAAATVETADYFLPDYQKLNVGDIILASVGVGGTPKLKQYLVLTCTSAGVTIGLQTTTAG
jgi:hypothetical protein